MTPDDFMQFHGQIGELTEQQAELVLHAAIKQVGSAEHVRPRAHALHNLVSQFLSTGFPEQDGVAYQLRMLRNDIDLRLEMASRAGVPE